jgi:uncharacterized coiled-coil protein SlyX
MEWIIIDDGTDKIDDLVVDHPDIPNIKYFAYDEKLALGKKRNLLHEKTCGDIIVYMDDDDYYPPERVSHAVEMLMANPTALCAGASEIYIYFKHLDQMFQFGPYGPNHATAGTFAFRRELLTHTRYNDTACLAEERAFLKDYSIPMVHLDPHKVILVFSHEHNTFDKRKLLENANPAFVRPTDKCMDDFIVGPTAQELKRFYANDLGNMLKYYEPGHPRMKPDVIQQTAELNRTMMVLQQQQQQQQRQQQHVNASEAIIMQQEGREPVALSNDQVIGIIQTQQSQVKELTAIAETLHREKAKLEQLLGYITAAQPSIVSTDDSNLQCSQCSGLSIALSACSSDLNARDETIKKLKALYMKSLVDASDLKTQLAELRKQFQDSQSTRFTHQMHRTNPPI